MNQRTRKLALRERFAQRLREARHAQGLSQEALAARAGLHRNYVGSVERGERNVSIDNMQKLSEALAVEVVELLR